MEGEEGEEESKEESEEGGRDKLKGTIRMGRRMMRRRRMGVRIVCVLVNQSIVMLSLQPRVDAPKLITFYLKSISPNNLVEMIKIECRTVRGRRRVTFDTS